MKVKGRKTKAQLPQRSRPEAGEGATTTRAGRPVAKLIAAGPLGRKRPLGMDRGKIWIADDFDAPIPELEALFYYAPLTTDESIQKKRKKK